MKCSNQSAPADAGQPLVYRYYAQTGGWRFVVLYQRGRKWLKLLETARLEVHTLSCADAAKLHAYPGIAPRQLAKRIRSRRARFKRLNVDFPARAVAQAIAALEQT